MYFFSVGPGASRTGSLRGVFVRILETILRECAMTPDSGSRVAVGEIRPCQLTNPARCSPVSVDRAATRSAGLPSNQIPPPPGRVARARPEIADPVGVRDH